MWEKEQVQCLQVRLIIKALDLTTGGSKVPVIPGVTCKHTEKESGSARARLCAEIRTCKE
jgi:hypothetical protein